MGCHYNFISGSSASTADACSLLCQQQAGCAEFSFSKSKWGCRYASNSEGCCPPGANVAQFCTAFSGWNAGGCQGNTCQFTVLPLSLASDGLSALWQAGTVTSISGVPLTGVKVCQERAWHRAGVKDVCDIYSEAPTAYPTTKYPTANPTTKYPTANPTSSPTVSPTQAPTVRKCQCTNGTPAVDAPSSCTFPFRYNNVLQTAAMGCRRSRSRFWCAHSNPYSSAGGWSWCDQAGPVGNCPYHGAQSCGKCNSGYQLVNDDQIEGVKICKKITLTPTRYPTANPTANPTKYPTTSPTASPTVSCEVHQYRDSSINSCRNCQNCNVGKFRFDCKESNPGTCENCVDPIQNAHHTTWGLTHGIEDSCNWACDDGYEGVGGTLTRPAQCVMTSTPTASPTTSPTT